MPIRPRTHAQRQRDARIAAGLPSGDRPTAAQRGYDRRWQKARKAFLWANPLCAECASNGRTTLGTVVDHVIPHRGDQALFWDESNWQALCEPCHNAKTARGE